MNYLSVENISKSYGEKQLFSNVTFGIEKGQKVAFIAKNGSGKTTLLNILAGLESQDGGYVTFRKGLNVTFLKQAQNFEDGKKISDIIFSSGNEVIQVINRYNEALKNSDDQEKYQEAFEEMNHHNAWEKEVLIQEILSKLKLSELSQAVELMSGGQQKRIALAQVLIEEPEFLILDEPTNHLDIEMIEWLENYLSKQNITLFMVTHDRYFLDAVCNEIIELDQNQIFRYKGNYTYFLEKRAHRYEVQQASIDKARNTLRKELEWMRRQPKARGTKAKSRVDAFYDTKKVAHKKIDEKSIELEVRSQRLGTKIIELHGISKSFNELKILENFTYTFKRKEKIGIVGENGSGKSTFLNILTQSEPYDKGKVVVGETIRFGHYKQEGIQFKDDKRVIDAVKDIAEYIPLAKGKSISAAQLLERFLFDRKMHHQYIKKLSGGEKRRLYLLTILMSNPNFLILDEPTNDLDIFTINALEEYLEIYDGCVLVVSHDRYFMNKLVDHTFVFEGNGAVVDIIGNYEDYRAYKKQKIQNKKVLNEESKAKENIKEKTKLSYKEKLEFEKIEKELEELELEKDQLTNDISNPNLSLDQITEIGASLEKTIAEIEEKTNRWLELAEYA